MRYFLIGFGAVALIAILGPLTIPAAILSASAYFAGRAAGRCCTWNDRYWRRGR